ncbi:hypothetical protein Tco_0434290 [Tanacetum coccineum]
MQEELNEFERLEVSELVPRLDYVMVIALKWIYKGETLYEYYWRFSHLINDMHTIRMTMQQVQVNTKFLNALPSEWSKFVSDVKLAKSLYTTNYDQLYAYRSQHERHANEVCITRERYSDPLALVANSPTIYNPSRSPQHSGSLMYPPLQQFTPVYAAPIHHQYHHTPVSPQQHSISPQTFIPPSVTQQSRAEFPQFDSSRVVPINRGIATTSKGNYATGQPRVVKCYNYQGEGYMARQCTQPKRPRNDGWFKEKLMLAEAQEADCDDLSSAKAVLMTNLSSCDPEVLSEVPYSDSYPNDMINQDVQEMQYSKQTHIDDFQDNEIHSDSNIILVIAKEHVVISVFDDEETLILEEESRSKMLDKQNDPISIKKKIKISPIDYSKLNKIKEYFGKHFVTKKELSIEQAFWLKHSSCSETPVTSHTPVRIKAPSELPKCLELETELLKKKDLIEKDVYDKLLKSYSTLKKHCISLELTSLLNQEVFQKDNFHENQNASTFNQLFELNELKAQSQEKDTVIIKLKDRINSLSRKDSLENVKKDIDEIETINIELEHSVAKLLSENENLRKE